MFFYLCWVASVGESPSLMTQSFREANPLVPARGWGLLSQSWFVDRLVIRRQHTGST